MVGGLQKVDSVLIARIRQGQDAAVDIAAPVLEALNLLTLLQTDGQCDNPAIVSTFATPDKLSREVAPADTAL